MSRTALADYLTELLWDGAVSAARRADPEGPLSALS